MTELPEVFLIVGRRTELFFLAVFSAGFLLHACSFQYTVDDAFISFRYARNWAQGEGLVFNHGEQVEGYSNFLWTLLIGGALRIGLDPESFARAAGLLAGVLLLWLSYRFCRRMLPGDPLAILLPVPIAANGAFALWSGAGLETPLFALLLFAGVAAAAEERGTRPFLLSSFLLALASLARPEGLLVYAVVLLDRLVAPGRSYRVAGAGCILFLLLFVPFELWRLVYYGDPLPNTYYAKAGGGIRAVLRGLRYAGSYLGPFGGWTVVAPLPLLFFVRIRPWERTFLAVLVAYIAYIVWIGGDSLPYFRFFAPLVPIFALLALSGLSRLFVPPAGSLNSWRLATFALLFALPAYASFRGETYRFLEEDRQRVELHWKVIGEWLGKNAREGESIAVTTAGAIPYFAGLPTVDMLGMTDKHIARTEMPDMGSGLAGHEKHDMEYVLSRRPTYILHYTFLLPEPVFATGQFRTPWNPGLRGLLENKRFDEEYRGEHAAIESMYLVYFRRKEES